MRSAGTLQRLRYNTCDQQRAAWVYSGRGRAGELSYPEFPGLINLDCLHLPGRIIKASVRRIPLYRGDLYRIENSYGQSLTSSASVVKKPGESVTLSCTVSGLSLSWLHWIRQKPGQGLEWIGRIDGGTGTIFAQSLQGQFSITKDTNKNMLYLEVKNKGLMTRNYIHWIRQKPGKALEWLGRIIRQNQAEYAESVKNQLTFTEDVSASTQYLEAKSLRTEDTAVYYCARQAQVTGLGKQLY
ncbi:hypothetical protein QTP86_019364 [Hemibagrus guttatus]|nr:hypothetical protein QTP86_019364 [Hemibagrus guttatus]